MKVHFEIHSNLCSVLLDFQSFTEKPVFESPFANPMILFLSHLVKNSVRCTSVICKSAMEWYLMFMCTSRLCPFKNSQKQKKTKIACYLRCISWKSQPGGGGGGGISLGGEVRRGPSYPDPV